MRSNLLPAWETGDYETLSGAELDALPVGSVRLWEVRPGLFVAFRKQRTGSWGSFSGSGTPSTVLADCLSATRVRGPVEGEPGPVAQEQNRLAAMHRVAAAGMRR